MENKESYTPMEVGELVKTYLEIFRQTESLREYLSRESQDKGTLDIKREKLRKKYEQMPRNVLVNLGLEDILQALGQLPSLR